MPCQGALSLEWMLSALIKKFEMLGHSSMKGLLVQLSHTSRIRFVDFASCQQLIGVRLLQVPGSSSNHAGCDRRI